METHIILETPEFRVALTAPREGIWSDHAVRAFVRRTLGEDLANFLGLDACWVDRFTSPTGERRFVVSSITSPPLRRSA